ncbi:bifunctional histidine phosphatase family protein/GNAT family N-acetyltransferase [Dysosmobacter sp.]|uniref:bifunctional histidine phosphatase family protein/GNAT family N-acetyltransferase n=1 Tax=Dysosmobacter sp. TaxID=2591382 RepID=UPI002A8D461B|nr:bifunctional histidine phosphatase family protein/GNAT family N-acetyltransferase [Dysosmobacter sp.]MDY3281595.1 bifunctional histidine phosphatase family protein/GNAT family N-acetyltransferase [Dysosmobacter sp.]
MTKIYLIRHAEAEGNLYRIAQGQHESLITDRGFRQIEALRRRFDGVEIHGVYSSDLYRTQVTAGAIYIPRQLPLRLVPGLREICVGSWEQKTWGEIARDDPEQMKNFSFRLDKWQVPGAETPEQVRDRVLDAVRTIARENEGKTAAVFSHGCAIRILLATLQGIGIDAIGRTPLGANTAVSLLEADGEELRVVYRDDVTHLTEDLTRKHSGRQAKPLDPGLIFTAPAAGEQAELLNRWTAAAAGDSGCVPQVPENAPALLGWLDGRPVGAVRTDPDREADRKRGWLPVFYVVPEHRCLGYGVQLLGQAVMYYRPLGRETLCVSLPEGSETALRFFTDYGFRPTGETTAAGERVLEKDIAFRDLPRFG